MLIRRFHRKVVPSSMGRGQAYRENTGKITCKPIPVLLKQLKIYYFALPFPTRDSKNKQKKSGPWQLATILAEWEENQFTKVEKLARVVLLSYIFTLEKIPKYFVCS